MADFCCSTAYFWVLPFVQLPGWVPPWSETFYIHGRVELYQVCGGSCYSPWKHQLMFWGLLCLPEVPLKYIVAGMVMLFDQPRHTASCWETNEET